MSGLCILNILNINKAAVEIELACVAKETPHYIVAGERCLLWRHGQIILRNSKIRA